MLVLTFLLLVMTSKVSNTKNNHVTLLAIIIVATCVVANLSYVA